FFFFFQAEDGIRDRTVTGVQTCALPIYLLEQLEQVILAGFTHEPVIALSEALSAIAPAGLTRCFYADNGSSAVEVAVKMSFHYRSEERRVGKEGRCRERRGVWRWRWCGD